MTLCLNFLQYPTMEYMKFVWAVPTTLVVVCARFILVTVQTITYLLGDLLICGKMVKGWVIDGKDESVNAENDKNMRNRGWMKAPRSFTVTDGKGETDLRNLGSGEILRRIITVQRLEKGKTYYLRFKSALNQSDAQFFSDYFEYVPRRGFNGTEPEDQW